MGARLSCCAKRDGTEFQGADDSKPEDLGGKRGSKRHSVSHIAYQATAHTAHHNVHARIHRLSPKITDDYVPDKKEVLGQGLCGSVYIATGKVEGHKFAVKTMPLINLDKDQQEELEAEFEIFIAMDHPHVVRLLDVYIDENAMHMVMECMAGGELLGRLQEQPDGRFKEGEAASIIWQCLLAVNYMHERGIAHRDLKLQNFLYEQKGGKHLKLADFGFGKITKTGEGTKKQALEGGVGTLHYLAPEILTDDTYDEKCDLWSFGVIVFLLLSGELPFGGKTRDEIMQHIVEGEFSMSSKKWEGVSDLAKDFVRKLLVRDPEKRLSAKEAMGHKFLEQAAVEDTEHHEMLKDEMVLALKQFHGMSRFKRACLSVMALTLPKEDRAKVRESFICLDEDNTGEVSVEELQSILEDKVSREEAESIFRALDTSGDGSIGYSEFLAAMLQTKIQINDALIKKTFLKLDKDRSGHISIQNIEQVMGEKFDGVSTRELLLEAGLDADGDGQVSFEEFSAFIKPSGPS